MKLVKKRILQYVLTLIFLNGLAIPMAAATYTVINTNDSGAGSLRQAILDANSNAGMDTIVFAIPGAGSHTIQPTSNIPSITGPIFIDGWSQGGGSYTGPPLIELNGSGLAGSGIYLRSNASGSTIKGLVINRFGLYGMRIGTENNTIHGCYIGTDVTGTVDYGNGQYGIYIYRSNNQIGGITTGMGNLISGNDYSGIYLSNVQYVRIEGNLIGTDINGTSSLGNSRAGIQILLGGNNTIGGAGAAYRNIISGNSQDGILVTSSSNNLIQACYIGTDISGTSILGNTEDGVELHDSSNNTIGGTSELERNIISGNVAGIKIDGYHNDASGNTIRGNFIGTDVSGMSDLGNSGSGINIYDAEGTIVGGSTSGAGNLVSGNDFAGISINDGPVTNDIGTTIEGNLVGTNITGTAAIPNEFRGMYVAGSNNRIGGTDAGSGNLVSGNKDYGIDISGFTSGNNQVLGNLVGTDINGTSAIPNRMGGIYITCDNNTIGGTTAAARNIASGNYYQGIAVGGDNNQVIGNFVGTDINGTADLGNTQGGISVGGTNHTIGGTTEGARNIVSGNNGFGIRVNGSGTTNHTIRGNYIGLDVSGTQDIGNSTNGIQIGENADSVTIGGGEADAANIIACNDNHGIYIQGDNNQILGNYIGTDTNGTNYGNSWQGIYLDDYASDNQIGGSGSGENNVIAYNGRDGIYLYFQGTGNSFLRNSIYANGDLGIDLYGSGITANDAGDTDTGANNRQNFPVITNVVRYPSSILIEGNLDSIADQTYTIEFFSNAALDPSGNGEGETYLGNTSLNIPSGRAVATFSVTLPVTVPAGRYITATATDPNGNTSEFSGGLITPTLALLSDFRAYSGSGGVTVEWTTSAENGTAGFMLMKKGEKDKQFMPVNQKLLPALPHATAGATYRLIDPSASSGETYSYKLIEVESSGKFHFHGPYQTTVDGRSVHQASKKGFFKRLDKAFSQKKFQIIANRTQKLTSRKHQQRLQRRKHFINKIKRHKKGKKHNRAKISIKENGIYYISQQQISEMLNLNPMQVKARLMTQRFTLTNRGKQVAWLPARGYRGILFYGEAIDNVHTELNVYWLKPGKGKLMGLRPGGFAQITEMQTFSDSLHIERDRYTLTALFSDPESDYWLWEFAAAGMAGKEFPFMLHSPAQTDTATLTVHLKGATPTPHQVRVSLNGSQVGLESWYGTDGHSVELSISPSLLQNGANTITVTNTAAVGVFYVDSFDLSYDRYYQAVNNQLFFTADENDSITISGFTDKHVLLFDITNPRQPKRVMTRRRADGKISFKPASPDHYYLAVGGNSLWQALAVKGVERSKLKKEQNSADYIVIVPPGFKEAAEKLTALRQASGFETMVVELEDIYNEFNHGMAEPAAIRSFLTYAHNNWNGGAPKYLVLAGDGSYDYKNNQQHNDCLVPSVMVSTPYGLFATDNLYGDLDGDDGVPEVAVGRIPVLTADELEMYVEKLTLYEESQGDWRGRMLFMADNGDAAGNFPSDSDSITKLVPGYQIDKVYLPQFSTVAEARAKLFASWNQGVAMVNFIGHAGLINLTSEGLFQKGDVAMLQNGDSCGVVTAFTCMMGRFSMPGFETLAESLVLHPTVGAVGCWVPSGMSLNFLAVDLAAGFYRSLAAAEEATLGELIIRAKNQYRNQHTNGYMLNIYNLLGDPAIKIK